MLAVLPLFRSEATAGYFTSAALGVWAWTCGIAAARDRDRDRLSILFMFAPRKRIQPCLWGLGLHRLGEVAIVPLGPQAADPSETIYAPIPSPLGLIEREGSRILKGLEVFQQRLFLIRRKLGANFMAATAVSGVSITAIGRLQCIVELGLIDGKSHIN
jgi:hypothetical protein